MYCMGEDAEDTLASANISEEDRKQYETVIEKFDAFFKVGKNVIFERARFNRHVQRQDESAEQFITSLYSLAENCAYGDLKAEMIHDPILDSHTQPGRRCATTAERKGTSAHSALQSTCVGGVMVPPADTDVIDTAYFNTLESERAKTS